MINKTEKLVYKLKDVSFRGDGVLIDEDAREVNLEKELKKIFGENSFDINCSFSHNESYDIEDF